MSLKNILLLVPLMFSFFTAAQPAELKEILNTGNWTKLSDSKAAGVPQHYLNFKAGELSNILNCQYKTDFDGSPHSTVVVLYKTVNIRNVISTKHQFRATSKPNDKNICDLVENLKNTPGGIKAEVDIYVFYSHSNNGAGRLMEYLHLKFPNSGLELTSSILSPLFN